MIHPSYTELIEAINANSEDDDTTMSVNSRYSLVLATSKRARQIIAGSQPLVENAQGKKPLSVAIDELYQGKVKILPPDETKEEPEAAAVSAEEPQSADIQDAEAIEDDPESTEEA
ncbi:MAG: DNA-directed RNA polymerase subunit omega [Blautia sp.]|nr:DNA-directed RNA polymerase subunit omega [Blautia sp.]